MIPVSLVRARSIVPFIASLGLKISLARKELYSRFGYSRVTGPGGMACAIGFPQLRRSQAAYLYWPLFFIKPAQ